MDDSPMTSEQADQMIDLLRNLLWETERVRKEVEEINGRIVDIYDKLAE